MVLYWSHDIIYVMQKLFLFCRFCEIQCIESLNLLLLWHKRYHGVIWPWFPRKVKTTLKKTNLLMCVIELWRFPKKGLSMRTSQYHSNFYWQNNRFKCIHNLKLATKIKMEGHKSYLKTVPNVRNKALLIFGEVYVCIYVCMHVHYICMYICHLLGINVYWNCV